MIGRVDEGSTGNEARNRGSSMAWCVGEACFSQARRELYDTRDSNATYLGGIDSKVDSLRTLAGNLSTLKYRE